MHVRMYVFIYKRERKKVSEAGAEREGDRGSEAGSLLSAESPMWGLNSRTRDHDLS